MQQLLVILVVNVLLFVNHLLVVLNLLAHVQVVLVALTWLSSQTVHLWWHFLVLHFNLLNGVKQSDLLFLNVSVFKFQLVKFTNEPVNLLTVLADSVKVLLVDMLNFNLDLLVLVQQIAVLVFQRIDVSLTVFHFLDLSLQLVYEELLVLTDALALVSLSSSHKSRSAAGRSAGSGVLPTKWTVHVVGRAQGAGILVLAVVVLNAIPWLVLQLSGISSDRWAVRRSALTLSVFLLACLSALVTLEVGRLAVGHWSFTGLSLNAMKVRISVWGNNGVTYSERWGTSCHFKNN